MKCAQGAFVLLNSLECAYWDGAIFERRGMVPIVRLRYTSVALVAACDLTYSARSDVTCQLIL